MLLTADGTEVVYQIQVETKKSSDELIFEEVWIDEKRFKVHLSDEKRSIVSAFDNKQIVNLNISEAPVEKDQSDRPKELIKSKVLVSYSIGNKRKFMSIRKFEENDENSSIPE